MLPKINRVKKKKDFEVVFKKGASYKSNLLILRAAKNNSDETRFGFVVSLKVSKKATVRNKIRRRLAETARIELANIKEGLDLVFIALPGIDKKDFQEIKDTFLYLLKKSISKNTNANRSPLRKARRHSLSKISSK